MDSASGHIVITDTSVLINFLIIDRLDLLTRLPGYTFHISEHVVAEVTDVDQAARIKDLIDGGHLVVTTITDPQEIALYSSFRSFFGQGESASLAIAQSRGWLVACDEKGRFFREARTAVGVGRILNTVSILVISILEGLLTVPEADRIKDVLYRNRFHIQANSFADLLPPKSST